MINLPSKAGRSRSYGELGGLRVQKTAHGDNCDICVRSGSYMVLIAGWVVATTRTARQDTRARFCANHAREMVETWERKGKKVDDGE